MTTPARRPALALTLVAALALAGCSSTPEATFEPAASDAAAPADDGTATATDTGSDSGTGTDEAAATEVEAVEPAEPRTLEIGETESFSDEDAAFTLTVHRLVVNDYYVEAEITVVNDSDDQLRTWRGGGSSASPRLYDDRGRGYTFQAQPGSDGGQLILLPAEGLDAVLVFAGRVDPEAGRLTLDLSEIGDDWSQMTFEVPVEDAR
jgi:hypothetical protein